MDALYHAVADKWKAIGFRLEINNLASIETKHRSDPQSCLLEMLEIWLKRVDPPPSWAAMVESLEFLKEEKLAEELREQYFSVTLFLHAHFLYYNSATNVMYEFVSSKHADD